MLAKAQSRMKMLTKLQEEAVAVGWKQLEAAGGWSPSVASDLEFLETVKYSFRFMGFHGSV